MSSEKRVVSGHNVQDMPSQAQLEKRADESGATQMSDSELKEMMLNKSGGQPTGNNNQFYQGPSEVIELPSKGLVYNEGSQLASGKIRMKYMTAREEDILTSDLLIKDGTVIDKLIQSMILDQVNYDDLVIGDRNWLMVAARILGYGSEYKFIQQDPNHSDNQQEVTINLNELEFKDIDESQFNNENRFNFTLPISKYEIEFQLMNRRLDKEVDKEINKKKFNKDKISRVLSTRTRRMILSINGETDSFKLDKLFYNISTRDLKSFRDHLRELQPDVILEYTFISDVDGEVHRLPVPFDTNFFWAT